jgi:alkanesulfonate monooxygenase SsuD/methylene tetrahydromethanopterin reductase-like flavin-dependent oxidoreductase (luciferase family)
MSTAPLSAATRRRSSGPSTWGSPTTEESLQQQFGAISDLVRPGVLTGSDDEIMARIGEYVAAGADQVNIALRAPFDLAALERFSAALHLS